MFTVSHLMTLARAAAEARGVSESTVSKQIFGHANRLRDLREKKVDVGYHRLQRAVTDLAAAWPENAPWPPDVPRPDQPSEAA